MPPIIQNIRALKNAGILAERTAQSKPLSFRKLNLVYGFNGSGKSTLSRLFASLEGGVLNGKLPPDCSFEVVLDNGSDFGFPSRPDGLQRRIVVFNGDFIDKNLQWATGRASPVFFIGAEQAEAAAELESCEKRIGELVSQISLAEKARDQADKSLATFKRERAKLTAGRLHWSGRRYEAPQLVKDYEQWAAIEDTLTLDDEALKAAEDLRRASAPMPPLITLEFEASEIPKAFRFISDICGQALSKIALQEIEQHPEMLLWLKQGHEFHQKHELESCLLCGSKFTAERREALANALDSKIDQFMDKLHRTSARLDNVSMSLNSLVEIAPHADAVEADLAGDLKKSRIALMNAIKLTRAQLAPLRDALNSKISAPASTADLSRLPAISTVESDCDSLASAIQSFNSVIDRHNKAVAEFGQRQVWADEAIRKHFLGECRDEFAQHIQTADDAHKDYDKLTKSLEAETTTVQRLRNAITTHGPAADAINKLVNSYLGHGELTVLAVKDGYEIHRHGAAIEGLPSEGEKTAIAIAYFLSTIESDGKKLKDMIVVVDDPVSSLDSRALNFACNLLKSRLLNAAQLFILTHNQQCVNEFRKAWKSKVMPENGKEPIATLLFLDVSVAKDSAKRTAALIPMSKLLREYDSEYHFLFSYVMRFQAASDEHFEHGYMMPNILRRVLDIFLAFRCPGNSGLVGKIEQLCNAYPEVDRDRLSALERLTQVESHSDNLDDLIGFSSMTIEETRDAATALVAMMEAVDRKHLEALRRICA